MDLNDLRKKILEIDNRDYGAYQSLIGTYDFPIYKLIIDHIPKDPFAPSHTGLYRIIVKRNDKRIINWEIKSKITEISFRDFIARLFFDAGDRIAQDQRGTGNSGIITINRPGQAILERSSVVINEQTIEIRCFLGLPAKGRKIDSKIAEKMLFEELPQIVAISLYAENINKQTLSKHIETTEDAAFLRNKLPSLRLTSFIANGSILPRKSGLSDQPLDGKSAIPFNSPKNLEKTIKLPHAGIVKGMGIPQGITLIVGGGFHGKSTLLKAIENGIYNHIPGDGREFCVSLPQTVKIRAYSGRSIVKTDISPFIKNLPYGKDTREFTTDNASGSTSQAAAIIEAIEIGADVLLMDEDTCAANFMIRDKKMQQLVSKKDEPITAFIDKVRRLYSDMNISTLLVLGGTGDYFKVSDYVIQMLNYQPVNVTRQAHKIAQDYSEKREAEDSAYPFIIVDRIPLPNTINPDNEYGKKRIYAKEIHTLVFGKTQIDLNDMEQLVELSQTKTIGYAIDYARKYINGKSTLKETVDQVIDDMNQNGLDILTSRKSGELAWFRGIELASTLNRLREFKVTQSRSVKLDRKNSTS